MAWTSWYPSLQFQTDEKSSAPAGAYKIKADGVYKGRLVVLGWSQILGIDCGGTFAPVCRLQSIRMVLAIVVELDYEVYMLDVQTTFFNADVEEEVFVKMALGYECRNESGVPLVMNKKSLYGLWQSPKFWFSTMDHHTRSGFSLSNRTRASTSTRTKTTQVS